MGKRLGVGVVGSGFHTRLHLQAWTGVRDADILGVWSTDHAQAAESAALARRLDVGAAKPYASTTAMVAEPAIDALWLCGPNDSRVENMEEIADAVIRAKGKLVGVACEKPLGRNVAEAQRVTELAAHAGVKHAYLENQAFAPQIAEGKASLWAHAAGTSRPHLARVAEEHAGPHKPDRLCHATLIVRYLLTPPGALLTTLRPKRVTGHIASDVANITIEFETPDGARVIGEATTGVAKDAILVSDAAADGYMAQDRHVVRAFLGLEEPLLTFADGLDVVRVLMTAYKSAEEGRTLDYPPPGLETFVPAVARGEGRPG